MRGLVEARKNKISRRKKAKARDTLRKAFASVVSEIDNDAFLRNHLFLGRASKDKLIVGGYIVVKTENDWFDIYKKNMSNLLYKDVFVFDAAMAIVESLNTGRDKHVKEILDAEKKLANNYMDMQIFRNAYKNAMETSPDDAHTFEDRYVIVKNRAKEALREIRKFRIAGNSKDR